MTSDFLVSITPEAILYLIDEERCVLIHTDSKGGIQIVTSKKEPESLAGWTLKEQDGIRIFVQNEVLFPQDRFLELGVKKRLFFTTLKASLRQTPKGAGFMGTRGCT